MMKTSLTKLKAVLLLAVLAMPLLSIASARAMSESTATAVAPAGKPGSAPQSIECCWIYYFGRWYCVPCG